MDCVYLAAYLQYSRDFNTVQLYFLYSAIVLVHKFHFVRFMLPKRDKVFNRYSQSVEQTTE